MKLLRPWSLGPRSLGLGSPLALLKSRKSLERDKACGWNESAEKRKWIKQKVGISLPALISYSTSLRFQLLLLRWI